MKRAIAAPAGAGRRSLAAVLAVLAVLAAPARPAGGGEAPRYDAARFRLPAEVSKLAPADLDGDGLQDLVAARGRRLEVHFQSPQAGFRLEEAGAAIDLPGESAGWDLEPARGGRPGRVLALIDGREVLAWDVEPGSRRLLEPRAVLAGLPGVLPRGVHHLPFCRDADGDGEPDLTIPGAGVVYLHTRRAGGGYSDGASVAARIRLDARLEEGEDLGVRVGQSLRVPRLRLRDVNGDGRADLVSRTDDRIEAHLAGDDGAFPAAPTFAIDLAAARARLGEFDLDQLDFSNLGSVFTRTVQAEMQDLDGDRIEDLLLREGGKVSIFRGRREGLDLERPQQVLRAGGNVIAASVLDEDGDRRPDLLLFRIEAVSIGDVFLWLVASGSIDFEVFVYRSDGGRFASRPARKITVTARFPSIPSLLELARDFEARIEERKGSASARADLAGRGARADLVTLRGGVLDAYLGAGERAGNLDLLALIDYRRDRDEYVLDLEKIIDALALGGDPALAGVAAREPDLEIPVPGERGRGSIAVLELNGDGRDDLILLGEPGGTEIEVMVVLSRP